MEVNSSNSNQFTPKLGQVSKGSLATESFSSHLVEDKPTLEQETPPRADRDQHRETEDRQASAAEARSDAKAAERKRAEEARTEDARNRDDAEEARAADAADKTTDSASTEETEDDTSFNATILEELATAADENADGIATQEAPSDVTDRGGEVAAVQIETKTTDTKETAISATPAKSDVAEEALIAPVGEGDGLEATNTADKSDIAISADKVAANAAQEPGHKNTNTEAARAAAQQAVRPTDLRAANNNANAQIDATASDTNLDSDELLSSLDPEFDTNADSDGKPGLGAKIAEAMANKNKAAAGFEGANNNLKAANSPTGSTAATPAASASLPSIPLQTLASLGLSTNGLPAGMDFDQLGLSSAGQTASTPQNSNPVLVRFGVLPGQAQATQVPNTAIALQIAKHVAKGVSTFEIRLDPAELGRVDVKLELAQDGRTTAHLVVERPETLDLLQRDAKALEQALRDAGLNTDETTLKFSLDDGNSRRANADPENADGTGNTSADREANPTQETSRITALAARQLQAASRGGIDVSI
ncbi:MAG: flagellar hook-length control protein FliK [Parvibaculum sp.]